MSAAEPVSLVGTVIGQYGVVAELGRGGMGVIYKAVHRTIGQLAAVKVLQPDHAKDALQRRRFLDEARAASMIRHPSLVQIFDYGELPLGGAYILMEYLEGPSLRSLLDAFRKAGMAVPIAQAFLIARQVASALEAVHASEVLHRDLKPDNLLLIADPEVPTGERVKLLDFGIAKISSDDAVPSAPRTATGTIIGTAAYMSPEQCSGQSDIGSGSDVYSLGIVLFEMLAGDVPFGGTYWEVLRKHMNQAPPALRELRPGLRDDLYRLVERMLAKEAARRPTMAEAARALRQLDEATGGSPDESVTPVVSAATREAMAPTGMAPGGASSPAAPAPAAGADPGAPAAPAPAVADERGAPAGDAAPDAAPLESRLGDPSPRPPEPAPMLAEVRHSGAAITLSPWRIVLGSAAGLAGAALGLHYLVLRHGPAPSLTLTPRSAEATVAGLPGPGGPAPVPPRPPVEQRLTPPGMAYLKAGLFTMGNSAEELQPALVHCRTMMGLPVDSCNLFMRSQPRRTVHVSAFFLDVTEVASEDFSRWLGGLATERGALSIKGGRYVYDRDGTLLIDLHHHPSILHRGRFQLRPGTGRKPVVQVPWEAARRYCQSQGRDLPSEAQWEYAARGQDRPYVWGSEEPRCEGVAYARSPDAACRHLPAGPMDVGAALQDRTPEGVRDLAGNVAEWVLDRLLVPYPPCAAPCLDPLVSDEDLAAKAARPGDAERVIRGGDWAEIGEILRPTYRGNAPQGSAWPKLGFRCAAAVKSAVQSKGDP